MENHGLLVAAVVAVVAVVGMAMASGQPQGALLVDTCPEGYRLQTTQVRSGSHEGQGLLECVPNQPLNRPTFPSWAEGDAARLAKAQARATP